MFVGSNFCMMALMSGASNTSMVFNRRACWNSVCEIDPDPSLSKS